MKQTTAAIILAAGKGTRMKSKETNKVALLLGGKPMISYSVGTLTLLGIAPIVVVVGFAKDSIMKALGDSVMYAEQRKRLGTGHAVASGLKKLPSDVTEVLVIQGDDSAFYTKEIFQKMIDLHHEKRAAVTLLTVEKKKPIWVGKNYA